MRLPTMYPANMKALLLSQYNQLDIADLPVPVPGVGRDPGASGRMWHLRQ